MIALKIDAVAGVHPFGSLEDLHSMLISGAMPYSADSTAECPSTAFASLKPLGSALRRMPRLARLALAAAMKLPPFREGGAEDPETVAIVVATAFGSVGPTFSFMDSLLADGPGMASPTAFSHSVTNMTAAMLGQHLGLTGPAMTITDARGAPIPAALAVVAGLLASHAAETVLLCAVEECPFPMNAIISGYSSHQHGLEGAVAFVFSPGDGEAVPHLHLAPAESFHAAARVPAYEVHGPGPLAFAWNIALSALSLRTSAAGILRCQAAREASGANDIWLSMGVTP